MAGDQPRGHGAASTPRTERSGRTRRRLRVEERRDELLEAALQLFCDRAPEDISIDDVASAADASRALVYHYFGGKHELYIAALKRAAKQLSELLETPIEGDSLERLRISLGRYFDFVEDHGAGFTALLRGGPADRSGDAGEIIDGVRNLILNRILAVLGMDTPGPVLRITLRAWVALVETAGLDWLERKDLPRAQLEQLLIEQYVVLLRVAGRHDPHAATLLNQVASEDLD